MTPPATPPWTTRRLLEAAAAHLEKKEVDSPRLAAELIWAHILEIPRIRLYMDMDRPASELERAAYRSRIERAAQHEPVQYLLGEANFFCLNFKVAPGVLIPRSCTEGLVEHVVQHARRTPGFASPVIADIGTGSGCIAIALAHNLPEAHVIAVDKSPEALTIARENAARHAVADRIEFLEGDLYAPLHGRRCHYLVSNPPYLSNTHWQVLAPNVRDYEPASALRGGADGLDVIRRVIADASRHLEHPGQLVVEIAFDQKTAVLELAGKTAGLSNPRVLADHEGLDRMLIADGV